MVVRISPLSSDVVGLPRHNGSGIGRPAQDKHGWPLQWVQFSISDTGEGMPLSEQHKLFKPFSQIKDGAGPSKARVVLLSPAASEPERVCRRRSFAPNTLTRPLAATRARRRAALG